MWKLFQAAQGLDYLHSNNPVILHGDLKATNVLINDKGEAMLIDFGLAKVQQKEPTGFTTVNVGGGTLRWLVIGVFIYSNVLFTYPNLKDCSRGPFPSSHH
jgi:serine/threonine protein kinase